MCAWLSSIFGGGGATAVKEKSASAGQRRRTSPQNPFDPNPVPGKASEAYGPQPGRPDSALSKPDLLLRMSRRGDHDKQGAFDLAAQVLKDDGVAAHVPASVQLEMRKHDLWEPALRAAIAAGHGMKTALIRELERKNTDGSRDAEISSLVSSLPDNLQGFFHR